MIRWTKEADWANTEQFRFGQWESFKEHNLTFGNKSRPVKKQELLFLNICLYGITYLDNTIFDYYSHRESANSLILRQKIEKINKKNTHSAFGAMDTRRNFRTSVSRDFVYS